MRLTYNRKKKRFLYPFALMAFDDYIIVPRAEMKRASTAAYQYGKRHGLYFCCRSFGTKNRVRIMRIRGNERPYHLSHRS